MKKLTRKKNKKGFTLVELIIVVAVMAILVAVAVPTVISVVNSAKEATYDTNAATIETAIKNYEADQIRQTQGAVTINEDLIDDALEAANLGIEGTFYYQTTEKKVALKAVADTFTTASKNLITVVFTKTADDEEGYVTVSDGYVAPTATSTEASAEAST